jgi:hypothetical protein
MSTWRANITAALAAFRTVAEGAGSPVPEKDLMVDFCDAPHEAPKCLPAGKVAIYGFWGNGVWLKIGKAGPKSNARYTSQHYNTGSAQSTLARSLAECPTMRSVAGFDAARPGDWIKGSTYRVNILLPERYNGPVLALLEAYLHVRLKPRYEGRGVVHE